MQELNKKERKKLKKFQEAVRKTEQSFGQGFEDDDWDINEFLTGMEEVAPGLYVYKDEEKPPSGCPEWFRVQLDVRDYLAETMRLTLNKALSKLDFETLKSLGHVEFTLAFNCDCDEDYKELFDDDDAEPLWFLQNLE